MRQLPPGPRQGRLAQTVALHRDPLGFLRAAHRRIGDVFTLRLATGGPLVVVADPALASLEVAGRARRHVLPMASPRSVFGGDGEHHAAARARLEERFTPEAVAKRSAAMTAIAERHVARWPRGRPFRLLPRMRALADEVFVREVLGASRAPEELASAIGDLLHVPGNPPLTVPGPDDGLLGRLVGAEFRRRRARVVRALEAEPDLPADPDELLVVLMAAQEPMATALTRVTLCALEHGYSRAVAAETLRLYPSALASLRELTEPRDGLAPGTVVMVPIPLINRDPRRFEDPDAFRPERDQDGALPFGGGIRRCLGEHLAWAELDAIVPVALRDGLRAVGRQPEPMVLRATILVPKRSGMVSYSP